jgi:3-oxoacid CoA-transferase subunit A/glutaconate CoA-transferase subunit A
LEHIRHSLQEAPMEKYILILAEGSGELVGWRDPDENRAWIRDNKPRGLVDKRTSVREAVERFVHDGDFLAIGGFGHIRTPMALIYEIIRQKRRGLVIAGKTAVHDIDLLIGGGCVKKVECAYAFGHELRGLSPAGRRAVESGEVQVVAELSNAAYQWRFLAGMMGVPFIPVRNMAGTDTFEKSSAIQISDPWSGKPVILVPAAIPDVTLIHVPRCDRFGNAQIDGIPVEDIELARASRRVLLTTEQVVDDDEIRDHPQRTDIPFYIVDAVCQVKYGAHPTLMPYLYAFDEPHIQEWLTQAKTPQGAQAYLEKYVYGVVDFSQYLELVGGAETLQRLEQIEQNKGRQV